MYVVEKFLQSDKLMQSIAILPRTDRFFFSVHGSLVRGEEKGAFSPLSHLSKQHFAPRCASSPERHVNVTRIRPAGSSDCEGHASAEDADSSRSSQDHVDKAHDKRSSRPAKEKRSVLQGLDEQDDQQGRVGRRVRRARSDPDQS